MTALYKQPSSALQYQPELDEFLKLVRGEQVRSFLEIGSKFGGTLWQVAQAMRPNSRIVSVDIRRGHRKWTESEPCLEACIEELNQQGHDAHLIWGDSTSSDIVEQVFEHAPFDLVLIDANHTLPYVVKDWSNYGAMGEIVAFHDISWRRPEGFNDYSRIDVPKLWVELRVRYRSLEIKLDPTGRDNGFGVLWQD